MTNEIRSTPHFDDWLAGIKDPIGKAAITARISRAECGNFGDTEPVGDGVSEMRVFIGPGYRAYYVRTGQTRYLMLYGSDKREQSKGIKRAKEILDDLRGRK
ncbi:MULTISPECIES: type II toxin-antitoxin system RelE/ParE family toxin [unclassified Pseudomonas]|uniref:type II toxin-antitoxin system RelE/ParE family toxin n=1 Tax=unclassified Pseudomonas TaxID=196821 RepID=UPI002580C775|nr:MULTISPECIES: type II toxin-antitoxin system RelE/ParE family toxin [unclassified Pseudomonas]